MLDKLNSKHKKIILRLNKISEQLNNDKNEDCKKFFYKIKEKRSQQ